MAEAAEAALGAELLGHLQACTEDSATAPPPDSLKALPQSIEALESFEGWGAIRAAAEWLRLRAAHDSMLVKHKTLVTLTLVIEGSAKFRVAAKESAALGPDIAALAGLVAPDDPELGDKPAQLVREAATALLGMLADDQSTGDKAVELLRKGKDVASSPRAALKQSPLAGRGSSRNRGGSSRSRERSPRGGGGGGGDPSLQAGKDPSGARDVRIVGLDDSEHNGKTGSIEEYDHEQGRYQVRIKGSDGAEDTVLALAEENIVSSDAPEPKPKRKRPERKRRAKGRRGSIVDIGKSAMSALKDSIRDDSPPPVPVSPSAAAGIDTSPVDVDQLLELSTQELEDKLSDKVLTHLKRLTEDAEKAPPQDAIHGLSEAFPALSSEARAVVVDWLRRQLFSDSIVVRHKTLVALQILLENAPQAMLLTLPENKVAMLDIEAMKTFEAPDESMAGSKPVMMVREAAAAVSALAAPPGSPAKAASKLRLGRRTTSAAAEDGRSPRVSLARGLSSMGSRTKGSAASFRDAQKQKLLEAKAKLAKSRAEQTFGGMSKEMRSGLEEAVVESDTPLEPPFFAYCCRLAKEDAEPDGAAAEATQWLISRLEDDSAIVRHKALQLIVGLLRSQNLAVVSVADESRQVFEALVTYTGAEDPRVPSKTAEDDVAERAVGDVKQNATAVVDLLQQAQERVLQERAKRREEAKMAREALKREADKQAAERRMDASAMLMLLECTVDDDRPAPLEAMMGVTSVMQNAAVHREIIKDMGDFRVEKPEGTISDWAKSSVWAADTGGEKDENGAPLRAQDGIWREMWDAVVEAEASGGEPWESVALLRTPLATVEWLHGRLKEGTVGVKVKSLHLMKDLYDGGGGDVEFVAAVQELSTPFVSELLEYRAEPHPKYGDKPQMRVRNLARIMVEELHPRLREQRLEALQRRREEEEQGQAASTPRVLTKLGLGKKKSPTKADDGQQTAEAKRHDRAALLAGAMFKALDADGDGVLLCHEVLELARKTGGTLTEAEYNMVCKAVGTEPDHGLTEPHLLRVYTELNLGNIEQDFVLMGLELPEGESAEEGVPPVGGAAEAAAQPASA